MLTQTIGGKPLIRTVEDCVINSTIILWGHTYTWAPKDALVTVVVWLIVHQCKKRLIFTIKIHG